MIHVIDREWMTDAACRGACTDRFFPERGDPTKETKQLCAGCPVRQECLDYALLHNERLGLWGGESPRSRRALATKRVRWCLRCDKRFLVPVGVMERYCGDECRSLRRNALKCESRRQLA